MKIFYHFTTKKLLDGRPIPPVGTWLEHEGELSICRAGLHASEHPFDAFEYAPGPMLHQVELDGEMIVEKDKVCARRRKIIATIDATSLIEAFARKCALSVIGLWEAPKIVRDWLNDPEHHSRVAAYLALPSPALIRGLPRAVEATGFAIACTCVQDAVYACHKAARALGDFNKTIVPFRGVFRTMVEDAFSGGKNWRKI